MPRLTRRGTDARHGVVWPDKPVKRVDRDNYIEVTVRTHVGRCTVLVDRMAEQDEWVDWARILRKAVRKADRRG